jgi:hypothetical protein
MMVFYSRFKAVFWHPDSDIYQFYCHLITAKRTILLFMAVIKSGWISTKRNHLELTTPYEVIIHVAINLVCRTKHIYETYIINCSQFVINFILLNWWHLLPFRTQLICMLIPREREQDARRVKYHHGTWTPASLWKCHKIRDLPTL